MTKRTLTLLFTTIVLLAFGCSNPVINPEINDVEGTRALIPATDAEATINISSWGTSFDGTVTIKNKKTTPIEKWDIEITSSYNITGFWGVELVSQTGDIYKFKPVSWAETINAGASLNFGISGTVAGTVAPSNPVLSDGTSGGGTGTVTGPVLPPGPSGKLETVYATTENTGATLKGTLLIGNVNQTYYWNGSFFAVRNITFETTGQVTAINKMPYGTAAFTQTGNLVTMELGYPSTFGLGEGAEFEILTNVAGAAAEPANFKVNYMRGMDIQYPDYGTLPASWAKNKTGLTSADLINDPVKYYQTNLPPVTDDMIMYNPSNLTQIQIGQVYAMNYPVNTENNVRIHMYSKYMAMGLGLVYEILKINPNYMTALGTKENYAAGFVNHSVGASYPVMIDGVQWHWPIVAHVDGPFQQEIGNFNDAKVHMYDYLGDAAQHSELIGISADPNDPNFITSAFSSGLSVSVTREHLNAIDGANFNDFIANANDPNPELVCVTYAYNRGINMFLSKGPLGSNRAQALATTDLVTTYDMGGFGAHVPTVRAIVNQMNNDTSDIYDSQITWAEMEVFLTQLRKFYTKGLPTDAEWTAMTADVKKAFDVLKANWGGNTVSYRYDFLTLLRVAKKYLPASYQPRPTGEHWYYNVKNSDLH